MINYLHMKKTFNLFALVACILAFSGCTKFELSKEDKMLVGTYQRYDNYSANYGTGWIDRLVLNSDHTCLYDIWWTSDGSEIERTEGTWSFDRNTKILSYHTKSKDVGNRSFDCTGVVVSIDENQFTIIELNGNSTTWTKCESKEETEITNTPTEFDGKWIENEATLRINETAGSFISIGTEYADAYIAGDTYFLKDFEEWKNSYNDYCVTTHCRVFEIGNGVIKVGYADVYTNPSSSRSLWISFNAYPKMIKDYKIRASLKIGVEVKNWQSYGFSIAKDGSLTFVNDNEILKYEKGMINWTGMGIYFNSEESFSSISKR